MEFIISNIPGVYKTVDVELQNSKSKVLINIDIAVDLVRIPNMRIDLLLREVQQSVKEEVEYQTGFYLDEVNVYAKKIHLDEKLVKDKEALRKFIKP